MEENSKIFPREKLTFHAADKLKAEIIAQGVSVYQGDPGGYEFMQHFEEFAFATANAALNYTGADVLPGDLPASIISKPPAEIYFHAKIMFDLVSSCGSYGQRQLLDDLKALLRSVERDAWQQGQNCKRYAT